ncbi:unnamed protein product [Echinostoma caproni]|uniref:UDP-glucose 4-epimerase n=1 Tax=Echinostoma caproni TaxID=27848 RepID=A0A182ZZ77_9TREM|nr:unnamed protein product [Echinostoma caproni]
MNAHSVKKLVFSSSCTVYGVPQFLPLTENHPLGQCTSPYGATKYFAETLLKDLHEADTSWNIVSLRYFNPVGAHPSARIGEDSSGPPSNLMPHICQVAAGLSPYVNVYGNDYDTPDGTGIVFLVTINRLIQVTCFVSDRSYFLSNMPTGSKLCLCIRDYVHIVDLSKAHVSALRMLNNNCGLKAYNIGTGKGYSVLEIIRAMEKASGKRIPYRICARRRGDTDAIYADPSLAFHELRWKAVHDLDKMCEDQWRWQRLNPHGYDGDFEAGDH